MSLTAPALNRFNKGGRSIGEGKVQTDRQGRVEKEREREEEIA